MMGKRSNGIFINYDSLVAPIGETFVERMRRLPGRTILNVRGTEDGIKNGVDIKEIWDDTDGHHEVWHEVKTDQKAAQGKRRDHATAKDLYNLLTILDASPVEGGTGNMFVEIKQWNENRQWVKGWYPKYKKLLEIEERQGISHIRIFWYYTTTSGFIDVPNGGQRSPDTISHPDQGFPEHFNFAVQLPLRELISAVKEFAKPYGGVAKIVASGLPPYREDKQHGIAGILMPITQLWRMPENVLRVFRDESFAKADEITDALLCSHLNALENSDKENDLRMKGLHGSLANLFFEVQGKGIYLDREGIRSALEAPANAMLFIDVARSEERSRYDEDFVSGRKELENQIAQNDGRDVNAEMMKAHGWREFDPERDGDLLS